MDKFTKIILSAGLLAQVANGAETEEDQKIKELRYQTSISRSVKRSTDEVKRNIKDIRNKMLLSGVIDKSMISVVDGILEEAQQAGDGALQEAIKNLVLATDSPENRAEYLKTASKSQARAIQHYENMLEQARKNADAARVQAKLNELVQKMKNVNEETKEAEEKEAAGEKVSQEDKETLAERQQELTDLAEQLEKDMKALEKNSQEEEKSDKSEESESDQGKEEEKSDKSEKSETDQGKEEEKSDKSEKSETDQGKEESISEKSEEIAEQIEDGKLSEAAKNQEDLIAKLEKKAEELSGTNPAEMTAENSEAQAYEEIAKQLESQIKEVGDLEAEGLEGSELEESEGFNDAQANQQELENSQTAKGDKELKEAIKEAGEALAEGNLEEAREKYEAAKEMAKAKAEEAKAAGEPQELAKGEPAEGEPAEAEAGQPAPPQPGQPAPPQPGQPAPPQQAEAQPAPPVPSEQQGEPQQKQELNLKSNQLKKEEYARGASWPADKLQFNPEKMQQLMNSAPAEYRQLVKQYYEALSRTSK